MYINSIQDKKTDTLWWEYIKKIHEKCYTELSEDCSKLIHSDLNIDYDKTMKCVNDSFDNPDHGTGDNQLMKNETALWDKHGAHYIPSVIINNVVYRGILDPENVFSAICNGFKDTPEQCRAYVDGGLVNNDKVTFDWFIVVIIFLIILNIVLLLI